MAAGVLAIVLPAGSYVWDTVNTRSPVVQTLAEFEIGATLMVLAEPVNPLRVLTK